MRSFIALAAACAFAATAIAADVYPSKPVRIVVPFPPGGPADVLARTVGDKLQATLGQPVVVDNRPGAGGNIGMELVAKAAPDGHTLALAPAGNLTVNPSLYRNVPYDVARDFAPVTVIAAVPEHPGGQRTGAGEGPCRAHRLREGQSRQAQLRIARPRKRRPSCGRAPQEQRRHRHGARAIQRHRARRDRRRRGRRPGDVRRCVVGDASRDGGKLRALGVASPKRIASAPALPTLDESGLPGFDVTSWYSIVAPAGTPPAVVERLQTEIAKALDAPDVKTKLAGLGAEPVANTPSEFSAMIKVESAKWGKIVKDANIRPE